MSNSIRTFVAVKVKPEDELLATIQHLKNSFKNEAVKWVEPDNLHLTLKFLGDTTVEDIDAIKEMLEKVVSGFYSFKIRLHGIGFFKSKGQPRVLFANVKNLEPLEQIFLRIEKKLGEFGFEQEQRSFKPHLTLARIKFLKDKKLFYRELGKHKNKEIQELEISEVIFYQSILKPAGPEYKPLKIARLQS